MMDLFYRNIGNGQPLIILHGLYGSSDNWMSVAHGLSEEFEVFLPDMRNHGRSPKSDKHSYSDLCEDIYQFIKKRNLKKAIILGHSMGGKTAMYLSRRYPEVVSGLIVVDIAPRNYDQENDSGHFNIHRHIIQSMKSVPVSKLGSREEIDLALAKKIEDNRLRAFLLKNISRDDNGKFHWILNLDALENNLENVAGGFNVDDWCNVRIAGFPVLFFRGMESDYIADQDVRCIHRIFPAADIVGIPEAGHWLHAEKPSVLLENIRDYFTG